MKISEIRRVIESCNWSRNDLGGATRDEFRRMDVRTHLTKHIDAVAALVIAPRFVDDIADAAEAIHRARATIERWESMQTTIAPPPKARPGFRVDYVGRA